ANVTDWWGPKPPPALLLRCGVIGHPGRRVPLEVDQRVPLRAVLGGVAPAALLLITGRLRLPLLVRLHDSALLISHIDKRGRQYSSGLGNQHGPSENPSGCDIAQNVPD